VKSNIKTVVVVCNQCGSDRSRLVAAGRDREYEDTTTDVFTMVECLQCGLHFLNPRPDVSELETIYPKVYHSHNVRKIDRGQDARPLITRLRHRLYSRRFLRPLRYLGQRDSVDVLDVGCGDGWQLDLYRTLAPDRIRTYGVEIKEEVCAIARAKGHTVYAGRFEDLDLAQGFDLVNLSQVIEHVADPRAFMRHIWSVLRPGGILFLETPNTDTLDWRWFRSGAWGAYHIPRHWTLYDPKAIARLGDSTGFTLLEIGYNPAPVHWVWTFHNLCLSRGGTAAKLGETLFRPMDIFGGGVKAFALLSMFTLVDLAILGMTGRTSNMMAIFRKREEEGAGVR